MSLSTTTNLLFKFLGTVERFNLSLGLHEGLLIIILLVRPTKDTLSPVRIDILLLQSRIVGVVEAMSWHLELSRVPTLKRTDELLLDSIDLALAFCELHLVVLQLREVITVDLFQVLHFAQHDKFFFIDDLLSLLLKHVVLAELLFTLANLSLFLFPVEALFESINFTLVDVKTVSDALDAASLVLNVGAMLTDATFKLLPL